LDADLTLKLGGGFACFQFSQRPDDRGVLQAAPRIFAGLHGSRANQEAQAAQRREGCADALDESQE